MEINNNINAMHTQSLKMNDLAKDIANTTNNSFQENKQQEITPDLIKSITEQIPTQIAYEAQGSSIKTQDEIFASTINIKA